MLKQEGRKGDLAGPECRTSLACEPLSAREAEDVSVLLKAIADPVRLRLLSLIACHEGGEACVCLLYTSPDGARLAPEETPPAVNDPITDDASRPPGLAGKRLSAAWVAILLACG